MSMTDPNTLDYLRSRFREIMNEITDGLATGQAADYSEYKEKCGVIQGLALAERELLDIKERAEKA